MQNEELEWEVPAGRIEYGESNEDAAKREAIEETACKSELEEKMIWQ